MKIQIINIPVLEPENGVAELNGFLGSHRITTVEKELIHQNGTYIWSFVVTYTEGSLPKTGKEKNQKIDYREVLSVDEFSRYAKLRELRNNTAKQEGKPPYAVFTNEQIAKMAVEKITTKTAFAQIEGVGAGRVEKYGGSFLALLNNMQDEDKQ